MSEQVTVTYDDKEYKLWHHGIEDYIGRELITRKRFFDEELLTYLHRHLRGPHKLVIDAGAHIGNHSVFFKNMLEISERIVAFEPVHENYVILQQNVAPEVVCLPIALTEKPGWGTIEFNPKNTGGLWLVPCGEKKKQILTATLDQFKFQDVTLIKIDIENSLVPMLEGSHDTINRCRPHLIAKVWPDAMSFVQQYCIQHDYTMNNVCWDDYHLAPL